MDADIAFIAAAMNKVATPADLAEFHELGSLVLLARTHGNDCGRAALAGLWMGQGMPQNEIIARLWPDVQRFTIAPGDTHD